MNMWRLKKSPHIFYGGNMNRRIRKKKEKKSLMEYSYEIVSPEYPYKKRKQAINDQWKLFHKAGYQIKIGYKRRYIDE